MKTFFEQLGGTYRQEGDYFIPDLDLPQKTDCHIGKYGLMRKQYLKEHRPGLYNRMILDETLFEHLAEIDQSCNAQLVAIENAMTIQEGGTEALKASNQMEWVRCHNSIRNRAEEIILTELVYA